MTTEIDKYYIPPTDEVFEEIKQWAIAIRETYDDTYGYRTEKLNRINDMHNIEDNSLYIRGMFDYVNQRKLYEKLSKEARYFILDRTTWVKCDSCWQYNDYIVTRGQWPDICQFCKD